MSANPFTKLGYRQQKRQETSAASPGSQHKSVFDATASEFGLARCQPAVNNVRNPRGEHLSCPHLGTLSRCRSSRVNGEVLTAHSKADESSYVMALSENNAPW